VHAAYEAKRAEIGSAGSSVLERLVLLRVIDSLWVEHLTAIDDMRRGIGLRAYSQRDPLDEFKREAYGMFDELKATIRHDVTHTIFRVTIAREPVAARPRRMLESRPEVAAGVAGGVASATATASVGGGLAQPVNAGPKVGRNNPCWCGSGKKYKRCHGA
jgi:Preprotein translocase subunit SecA (ATPase, RNA helicase)